MILKLFLKCDKILIVRKIFKMHIMYKLVDKCKNNFLLKRKKNDDRNRRIFLPILI